MKALGNEVAKNLVLAGIGSLTILDYELVKEEDLGAQFFISDEDIGTNRAQAAAPQVRKLNPRVNVVVDTDNINSKALTPSYFAAFDIIIATDLEADTLNIINTATRVIHKPFYAAGVHGLYGFIFSDLIQHQYAVERERGNKTTIPGHQETRTRKVIDVKTKVENASSGKIIEIVTKQELYSTWFLASDAATLPEEYLKSKRRLKAATPLLSCFRALWEYTHLKKGLPGHSREDLGLFTTLAQQKHKALGLPTETLRSEFLRSFLQNAGSELAPVTAQLGGQLAQDVINVLGRRQQPIQNMVLFDGDSLTAPVYALHPEGALGEELLPISQSKSAALENGSSISIMELTAGAELGSSHNGATNGLFAKPIILG